MKKTVVSQKKLPHETNLFRYDQDGRMRIDETCVILLKMLSSRRDLSPHFVKHRQIAQKNVHNWAP